MTPNAHWLTPSLLSLAALATHGFATAPQEPVLEPAEVPAEAAQEEKPDEAKVPEAKPVEKQPVQDAPSAAEPSDPSEILGPYLEKGLLGRLLVAPRIRKLPNESFATRYSPLLTGDRKRLILKVKNLVAGLADVRYVERERSERALENMGPSISSILEMLRKGVRDTEAQIRIERILKKLSEMGDEDVQRKALYARGLAEALEYRPGRESAKVLLSSLDHLDARVRLAAIRSLGTQLEDPALASEFGELAVGRLQPALSSLDLALRNAATVAIGGMPIAAGRAAMEKIAKDGSAPMSHRILALRLLAERLGPKAFAGLREQLTEAKGGPVMARLLGEVHEHLAQRVTRDPAEPGTPGGQPEEKPTTGEGGQEKGDEAKGPEADGAAAPAPATETRVTVKLLDSGVFESTLLDLVHDRVLVAPSRELAELGPLRLPRALIDRIAFDAEKRESGEPAPTLIFRTGTRVAVEELTCEGGRVRGKALGRSFDAPLSLVTRLKPSPLAARAPGGSRKGDQLRVAGEKQPIEGKVLEFSQSEIRFQPFGGEAAARPWTGIDSIVMQLRPSDGAQEQGDLGQYVQADLVDGQVVVGFLVELGPSELALASPALGVVRVPNSQLLRMQMANSGRAQAGFTLICEYDEMEVYEMDGEGRKVWRLEALLGPTSAKPTPSGNVLIVEQDDSAVREYDRDGVPVWEFPPLGGKGGARQELQAPRDADRLPNGHTLICETGGNRVIEVTPDHEVVWTFSSKQAKSNAFSPYNADRLANGNTLIADYGGNRIIEVDPRGKIVWERKGLSFPWDADRLPNGNTLVVCSKPARVIEIDPAGQIVWEITNQNGLQTPTAVERLPDGTTMVCDVQGNGKDERSAQIRFFDRAGRQVKKIAAEYPLSAKRY